MANIRSKRRRILHLGMEPLERREMLHGESPLPTVTLHTNVGDIEWRLLVNDAPGHVENFLDYVNAGAYVNSIFHRLDPGFVLQGGGFSSSTDQLCDDDCPTSEINVDSISQIPTNAPVVNDFGRSNLRGTVSMARLSAQPNSATNQFFINYSDTNSFLDNVDSNGFTVFAEVIDMKVADQIETFDIEDVRSNFDNAPFASAFRELPTHINPQTGAKELVRIESVSGTGIGHGTVYLDVDGDSVRDTSESGAGNFVVYDDGNNNGTRDTDEVFTETDDQGRYHLLLTAGSHVIRVEDVDGYDVTLPGERHLPTVAIAEDAIGMNFGVRYTGTSWHNPLSDYDVDAINGITPLDALLVINELNLRKVSDPVTFELQTLESPLPQPRFYDVFVDNQVTPLDALRVVNNLPGNLPQLQAPQDYSESAEELASDDESLGAIPPLNVGLSQFPTATQIAIVDTAAPREKQTNPGFSARFAATTLDQANPRDASAEDTAAGAHAALDSLFAVWE